MPTRLARPTLTAALPRTTRPPGGLKRDGARSLASMMAKYAAGAYRGFALDRTQTYTTQDWDALQATGANIVRAPIWMNRAPTGISYAAPDLTWHIDAMNQCALRGIGVILTLVPFPDAEAVEYWDIPELQPHLAGRWVEIAQVVRNHPALVGYDIINEPVGGAAIPGDTAGTPLKKAYWLSISQPICTALRAVDPNTPILWEPYRWGLPDQFWQSEAPTVEGLVLSCHWYQPKEYTHQGIGEYPTPLALPVSDYSATLLEARKIAARRGLPMFIGECGNVRWAPEGETWFARAIALFRTERWGWCIHVWRPVWEGWDTEIPIGATYGQSPGSRSPTSPAFLAVKAGIAAP